jgi:hypothetical protein
MTIKHAGPAPSERALFELWDKVDAARMRDGEREATRLAQRALQAVEPPPQKGTQDASSSKNH